MPERWLQFSNIADYLTGGTIDPFTGATLPALAGTSGWGTWFSDPHCLDGVLPSFDVLAVPWSYGDTTNYANDPHGMWSNLFGIIKRAGKKISTAGGYISGTDAAHAAGLKISNSGNIIAQYADKLSVDQMLALGSPLPIFIMDGFPVQMTLRTADSETTPPASATYATPRWTLADALTELTNYMQTFRSYYPTIEIGLDVNFPPWAFNGRGSWSGWPYGSCGYLGPGFKTYTDYNPNPAPGTDHIYVYSNYDFMTQADPTYGNLEYGAIWDAMVSALYNHSPRLPNFSCFQVDSVDDWTDGAVPSNWPYWYLVRWWSRSVGLERFVRNTGPRLGIPGLQIPFGAMYNDDYYGRMGPGANNTARTRRWMTEYHHRGGAPEQEAVAYWYPFPQYGLPPTDVSTHSGVMKEMMNPRPTGLQPIWQLLYLGCFYYTMNASWRDYLVANGATCFGATLASVDPQDPNAIPIHQFAAPSPNAGWAYARPADFNFYTTNGWTDNGLVFYAYADPSAGSRPVYRSYSGYSYYLSDSPTPPGGYVALDTTTPYFSLWDADKAWHTYRAITIDHTKCGPADLPDFTFTFTGTYSFLAQSNWGGLVQSTLGYDICFFADQDLTDELMWEMANYDPGSGTIEAHIKIPVLTAATNTTIYLAYGNGGIASFQGGLTSGGTLSPVLTGSPPVYTYSGPAFTPVQGCAWDASYVDVHHFGSGTALNVNDSTNLQNHTVNNAAAAVSGKVGGAVALSTTSSVTLPGFTFYGEFFIEFWIKTTDTGKYIWLTQNGTPLVYVMVGNVGGGSTGQLVLEARNDAGTLVTVTSNPTIINDGNWHWCIAQRAYDSTSAHYFLSVWVDGFQSSTALLDGTITAGGVGGAIGGATSIGAASAFGLIGDIDELRVSNVVRRNPGLNTYVATAFYNLNSPSTFYTVGTAVGVRYVPQNAGFVQTNTRVVAQSAALYRVGRFQPVHQFAVLFQATAAVHWTTQFAVLLQTNTRRVTQAARLFQARAATRVVIQGAGLTLRRLVSQSAVFFQAQARRTVTQHAVLVQTNTRLVTQRSTFAFANTHPVTQAAILVATNTRQVSQRGALFLAGRRSLVTQHGALIRTPTRLVTQTAPLVFQGVRLVGQQAIFRGTEPHAVRQSAALLGTKFRTVIQFGIFLSDSALRRAISGELVPPTVFIQAPVTVWAGDQAPYFVATLYHDAEARIRMDLQGATVLFHMRTLGVGQNLFHGFDDHCTILDDDGVVRYDFPQPVHGRAVYDGQFIVINQAGRSRRTPLFTIAIEGAF
jgi:hypothetical protein